MSELPEHVAVVLTREEAKHMFGNPAALDEAQAILRYMGKREEHFRKWSEEGPKDDRPVWATVAAEIGMVAHDIAMLRHREKS